MPIPLLALAGGSLLAKGLGSLFGHRAQSAQSNEDRQARIALLNLLQHRSEDSRLSRLKIAQAILGAVPKTTSGGAVNTNVFSDPALFAQLGKERTYDFGATVPESKGGFDSFLSGLFGGAADTLPRIASPAGGVPDVGGVDSQNVAGGFSPAPIGGPSSSTAPNITLEQLLAEDPARKAL